jgi:hypothetical protein
METEKKTGKRKKKNQMRDKDPCTQNNIRKESS